MTRTCVFFGENIDKKLRPSRSFLRNPTKNEIYLAEKYITCYDYAAKKEKR